MATYIDERELTDVHAYIAGGDVDTATELRDWLTAAIEWMEANNGKT